MGTGKLHDNPSQYRTGDVSDSDLCINRKGGGEVDVFHFYYVLLFLFIIFYVIFTPICKTCYIQSKLSGRICNSTVDLSLIHI